MRAILLSCGVLLLSAPVIAADPPPPLDLTGPFLYVRLRRTAYRDEDVAAWADRIAPFVASGVDAYAFFRHDEDGTSAIRAEALGRLLGR